MLAFCLFSLANLLYKEVNYYDENKSLIQCGLKFYEKSCDLKNGEACFILGYYFYKEGFYGIKKNNEKSNFYIKKACELNYTKACKYLHK